MKYTLAERTMRPLSAISPLWNNLKPYLKFLQIIGICPFSVADHWQTSKPILCYPIAFLLVIFLLSTLLLMWESSYSIVLSYMADDTVWNIYYNSAISMYANLLLMTTSYISHIAHLTLMFVQRKLHLKLIGQLIRTDHKLPTELNVMTKQLDTQMGTALMAAILSQAIAATAAFYHSERSMFGKLFFATIYGLKQITNLVIALYVRHLASLIRIRITLVGASFESLLLNMASQNRNRTRKRIEKKLLLLSDLFHVKWVFGQTFGGNLLVSTVFDFINVTVQIFGVAINMYKRNLLWFDIFQFCTMCVPFMVKSTLLTDTLDNLANQVIEKSIHMKMRS